MGSLRTLFLAVHASNGLIKALFLPTCYLTLFSPFALVIAWYFGFLQTLENLIPEDFSWFDLLPQFALSAVLVLLPTRFFSASAKEAKSKDGKRRIQPLPYWIPALRHLGSIAFGGEEWLSGVRDSSTTSIIAYKAAGSKHHVLLSEALLDQLYKSWQSLEDLDNNQLAVLGNAFRLPSEMESHYLELVPEINQVVETDIYGASTKESLIKASLSLLAESLPDVTTFNSSIVDQMQWERVSNVELTDGTSEAECDFFMLINEFCCNAILPPIVGLQFTESYQLLPTDLASLNERFWALALGLPRLSPIQGLPGAALAQKRLVRNFANHFADLTNPPVKKAPADDESVSGDEDTDAETVTPLMKLNELFTKHDLPMELRASIALRLVHDVVSEVVPLVFWTLLHIYSSSRTDDGQASEESPLEKIKKETKNWAQAGQPPSIHPSFPAPPEIRFGSATEALTATFSPYLRSSINEARRLYGCSASTYKIAQPVCLKEEDIARPGEQEQWELEAGSYVDIGLSQSMINSSPASHPAPHVYKPDRFLNVSIPSSPNDSSESFKTALLIPFIAGIIQLWEIAPAPKKSFLDHLQEAGNEASIGAAALTNEQKTAREEANRAKENTKRKEAKWVLPKAIDGASIKVPKGDIRVRVRRREGLPTSKLVRRIG
ncbi:cytochrome p450 protein [Stemphylium lycopersici]|nr:cytochrome p450 protein [Stemphylium lycopersici]RAQ99809.1 cytochrome p450 protein [Stemphylium lycopersici]